VQTFLNYRFNFSPDIWVGSMYTYTRANVEKDGATKNVNWNQVALIADYLLSKRTDVYVTGSYQRVGGATTGTGLDQAYIVGSAGTSSNRNQTVARIDFRLKI
jgi:predicted porin